MPNKQLKLTINFETLEAYEEFNEKFHKTFILNDVEHENKTENRGMKTKELHRKAREMYQHYNPENLTYHNCFKIVSEKNNNINENI